MQFVVDSTGAVLWTLVFGLFPDLGLDEKTELAWGFASLGMSTPLTLGPPALAVLLGVLERLDWS